MNLLHPATPVLIASVILLAACGSQPETPVSTTSPAAPPAFVHVMPEGEVLPIPVARTQVKPGEEVLIEGKVMGVMTPFVENRAVVVIGDDDTITSCDETEGDGCETPWDACCDPREIIQAGIATVQILDGEGQVLKQGLKGVHGLRELSRVRVRGVVAPQSTQEAFLVNATAFYTLPEAL